MRLTDDGERRSPTDADVSLGAVQSGDPGTLILDSRVVGFEHGVH
jgi:hypothetical protein